MSIRPEEAVHDRVYQDLKQQILCGRLPPGIGVSLRSLAAELGVSPMPVRDAVRRLSAEGALAINPANKRLFVPPLTADRLEQLARLRLWVEPELARRAIPGGHTGMADRLKRLDDQLNEAIAAGDVQSYMALNHQFHFAIYQAADAPVFLEVATGLWLKTGPFMRVVFGRVGTVSLGTDHHLTAIDAFERGDAEAAAFAISEDIRQGMTHLSEALDGAGG